MKFFVLGVVCVLLVSASVVGVSDGDANDDLKKYIFLTVDSHDKEVGKRLDALDVSIGEYKGELLSDVSADFLSGSDRFFIKGSFIIGGSLFFAYFFAAFLKGFIDRRHDPLGGLSLIEKELHFRREYWKVRQELDKRGNE